MCAHKTDVLSLKTIPVTSDSEAVVVADSAVADSGPMFFPQELLLLQISGRMFFPKETTAADSEVVVVEDSAAAWWDFVPVADRKESDRQAGPIPFPSASQAGPLRNCLSRDPR
jgi:hypothetical protein